jgi:hypothetical protein
MGKFHRGVIDELKVFGAETVAEQEDVYLIAKTLLKLPKEVREKVLDEVCFIIKLSPRPHFELMLLRNR